MTVKELFDVINTDYAEIEILDYNNNVVYSKEKNTVITKVNDDIWSSEVAWIYKIDSTMINVRVDNY